MRYLAIAVTVTAHLYATTLYAQRVYWVDQQSVQRVAPAGSDQDALIDARPFRTPSSIALDLSTDTMYWTEYGTPFGADFGSVRRASIQGVGMEVLVDVQSAEGAQFISLETRMGHMYWTEFDADGGTIRRANLDGSDVTIVLAGGSIALVGIDPDQDKLYWIDQFTSGIIDKLLMRSNLDGSNTTMLFNMGSNVVSDAALDLINERIYWAATSSPEEINRANFDGTDMQTLYSSTNNPQGIALDLDANKMYWTELSGAVRRANLDGSAVEDVVTQDTLAPAGIALDTRECGGHGMTVAGICVCDSGWQGTNCDCTLAPCVADCSGNGACECGVCECDEGWAGEDCSCTTVCPQQCSGNGSCDCGTCVCDAGWEGLECSCSTAPCLDDCSGNGICECGVCFCDPGWEGPDCSCQPSPCPNNCSGNGVCECGVCQCDPGWSGDNCGTPSIPQVRLFMALDGEQTTAPIVGETTAFMEAGTTAKVMVWFEDSTGVGDILAFYQIILPFLAIPAGDATGIVSYVDNDLGAGFFGDTVFVDVSRTDWLYASDIFTLPAFYNETPDENFFGAVYFGAEPWTINPADIAGISYVCEFDISASPDATGDFRIDFRVGPSDPPNTGFVTPPFDEYAIDQFQSLIVSITECGDGTVEGAEECDDGNNENDDGCSAECTIEPPPIPASSTAGMAVMVIVLLGLVGLAANRQGNQGALTREQ